MELYNLLLAEKNFFMEKDNLEELEDTMLPAEQAGLISELSSKVDFIVSSGIMTPQEGQAWISGGWACEQRSHLENLIDIIDSFVASGEDKQAHLGELLQTNLLTSAEKQSWQHQFELLDYAGKKQALRDLSREIKDNLTKEKQLTSVIEDKQLPPHRSSQLWQQFYLATSLAKDRVISAAQSAQLEIRPQPADTIEQLPKSQDKTKPEEPNSIETQVVQSTARLNPRQECQKMITHYLKSSQFTDARGLLRGSRELFNLKEYVFLSERIDVAEIKSIRLSLKAA